MSQPMHPVLSRTTVTVLAALLFAAPGRAQTGPAPCPTPRHPPLQAHVLPLMPCPTSEVRIGVVYTCCTTVALAPPGAGVLTLDVTTFPDSCANVHCLPETLFVPLGHFVTGNYTAVITYRTTWYETGGACHSVTQDTLRFAVGTECVPQTGIPFLQHVEIGRNGLACPGDSIPVRLSGALPDNCTDLLRVEVIPSPVLSNTSPIGEPPLLRLVFAQNSCLGRPCVLNPVPWSATVKIGPLFASDWRLGVDALLLDVCPQPPDTTRLGADSFPFTVLASCDSLPTGCLLPEWVHAVPGARCDAFLQPGHDAQLTMTIGSTTALAALQGKIVMQPLGLHVTNVEAVGPASGMQLTWNLAPEGVRFVLYATEGAPIPGGTPPESSRVPVLRLTFAPDLAAPPPPRTRVFPAELLGADAFGRAVYVCPTFAVIDASAYVCVAAPCDFNGDGVADVRDLVRMVRCITGADVCDPEAVGHFDCDESGLFDLDDVLCCARVILGEAPQPGAGDSREASLHVTMGLPATVDGAIEIPVEITGDQPVGAARLVLGLPTNAFSKIGVRVDPGTADLAVHEVGPGAVTVGVIRTAIPATGTPLRFTLRLTPLPGVTPAGEVALTASDFSGPDGVRLIADPGEPVVVLGMGDQAMLAPARPNPFRDTQRISLVLPQRENVDLSIFDLSGRRVRTLYHGPLAAGGHGFTWDGRDDHGTRLPGGVYFYRAAVDGDAVARRVVKLDDSR